MWGSLCGGTGWRCRTGGIATGPGAGRPGNHGGAVPGRAAPLGGVRSCPTASPGVCLVGRDRRLLVVEIRREAPAEQLGRHRTSRRSLPRPGRREIVLLALSHQDSESLWDRSTRVFWYAWFSSGHAADAGRRPPRSRRTAPPANRLPAGERVPDGHVVGMLEHLEHVVAGRSEQSLQRQLQRMGTGPAHPRTDDANTTCGVYRPSASARVGQHVQRGCLNSR
jgi:hypothetical protein